MASHNIRFVTMAIMFMLSLVISGHGQLSPFFYARSCPNLRNIVRAVMFRNIRRDPSLGAGVLRIFFHDCFVNGCDASVLLDDTAVMVGEKNAGPNRFSLRGFEVIDNIKHQVEIKCPRTVSCADIIAIAARDAVNLLGGPKWNVLLGRRDSRTASQVAANSNLPPPSASINNLIQMFNNKGLSPTDLVALSGAHTIGNAHCSSYRSHIYNDKNINSTFAIVRRQTCPAKDGDRNLASLDVSTPTKFDNNYYHNLLAGRGLLHSDQELFNNGPLGLLVRSYAVNPVAFANDFADAMIKMGNINPLTGFDGEIRRNCRRVN